MPKLFSIALVGLIASAPAAAQITFPAQGNAASTPAPASAQAQSANPGKSQIICEQEETIGSRLGAHKVCHTAAEWQLIKSESRESLEKYQQQAKGPVSG